jgi:hypothetical protein
MSLDNHTGGAILIIWKIDMAARKFFTKINQASIEKEHCIQPFTLFLNLSSVGAWTEITLA